MSASRKSLEPIATVFAKLPRRNLIKYISL